MSRWLNKNDMPITDTGDIRTEGTNLIFKDPQQIDSGNYTFIVNNTAGDKQQSVWIIVSGMLSFPKNILVLTFFVFTLNMLFHVSK